MMDMWPFLTSIFLYNNCQSSVKMYKNLTILTISQKMTLILAPPLHGLSYAIKDHFRCNLYMLDHKEEINIPEQYLFSIRPSQPNLHRPVVTCDFSPIQCRKTFKLVRTIPTYHPQLQLPFQTEVGLQMHSMCEIPQRKEGPIAIQIPKPTHHFCQVCKQPFDDYMKHITHPLHQKRSRQSQQSFSLDSLKDILEIKRKKGKKITWFQDTDSNASEKQEETKSVTSLECVELKSHGSKKRIILKEGEMEPVSLQSSTKCQQDDLFEQPKPVRRKVNRKYSHFRQSIQD